MRKPEKRVVVLWSIAAVGLLLEVAALLCYLYISRPYRVELPQNATREITQAAENAGLEEVSVSLGEFDRTLHSYDVTVSCSNFDQFSYPEMIRISDSLDDAAAVANKACTARARVYVIYILCGDRKYLVNSYDRTIWRSEDNLIGRRYIYDDYFHSQFYYDYLKEHPKDQDADDSSKSSSSNSSSSSSSSGSSSSRKSQSSTSDPYNAASYWGEDDFYEDYYDEFYDYEDAEQYWRDHQG
jgi:hypothetical protein